MNSIEFTKNMKREREGMPVQRCIQQESPLDIEFLGSTPVEDKGL